MTFHLASSAFLVIAYLYLDLCSAFRMQRKSAVSTCILEPFLKMELIDSSILLELWILRIPASKKLLYFFLWKRSLRSPDIKWIFMLACLKPFKSRLVPLSSSLTSFPPSSISAKSILQTSSLSFFLISASV